MSYAKDLKNLIKSKATMSIFLEEMKIDLSVIFDLYNLSKDIAYEIKTSRDSLTRLSCQIQAYNKVFREYYVVTDCHTKKEKLLKMNLKRAGVLFVKDNKIKVCKKATVATPNHNFIDTRFDDIALKDMVNNPHGYMLLIKNLMEEEKRYNHIKVLNSKFKKGIK